MSTEVKIGPARPFEREAVEQLWSEEFGFFGHEEELLDDAFDTDHNGIWCLTVGSREELWGFALVTRVPRHNFDNHYDTDTRDWPVANDNGNVDMLCVAPDRREQGIGTRLVERCHRWLCRNDIVRTFAVSWHREDRFDSRPLFRSLGYQKIGEEEGYYDDEDYTRDCPDCGAGCSCTASFWTRTLRGDDDA